MIKNAGVKWLDDVKIGSDQLLQVFHQDHGLAQTLPFFTIQQQRIEIIGVFLNAFNLLDLQQYPVTGEDFVGLPQAVGHLF